MLVTNDVADGSGPAGAAVPRVVVEKHRDALDSDPVSPLRDAILVERPLPAVVYENDFDDVGGWGRRREQDEVDVVRGVVDI